MANEILAQISEKIQKGKTKDIKALVPQALEAGIAPADILNAGLLDGMNIVGIKFKNNEVFVPEVLIAARAMKAGTDILKPYLVSDQVSAKGKVVLGTVRGDFHDIGKNLVKMMMEGHGLEVIDLGVDVAPEAFVTAAKENGADIIIGAHPHVVQDTASINNVPVVYSLGNAVSNMSAPNTQLELMATVKFVRQCNGDISMEPIELTWLWCSRPGGFNNGYTVVPIEEYIGRRDEWTGGWDYDKMMSTYEEIRK